MALLLTRTPVLKAGRKTLLQDAHLGLLPKGLWQGLASCEAKKDDSDSVGYMISLSPCIIIIFPFSVQPLSQSRNFWRCLSGDLSRAFCTDVYSGGIRPLASGRGCG